MKEINAITCNTKKHNYFGRNTTTQISRTALPNARANTAFTLFEIQSAEKRKLLFPWCQIYLCRIQNLGL